MPRHGRKGERSKVETRSPANERNVERRARTPITHPPAWFDALRSEHRQGSVALADAVRSVREGAEALLTQSPVSIVRKTRMPPSGDPHDYVSMGPYWWPNPATPDGLPYVRRDGELNPECHALDRPNLDAHVHAVQRLALAWFLDGDKRFASTAVRWLEAFFLDPTTRMNPNLRFGQAVPGVCEGRGIGIIETRVFASVLLDSVQLLGGSDELSPATLEGLQAWFRDYLRWLLESEHGRREDGEHNNHGTAYDLQVAAFARFVGDSAIAADVLRRVPARRIMTQVEPDGRQPHELARTRSLSYATMNLHLLCELADLAAPLGIDLWRFVADDGRCIRRAVDWLLPFWTGAATWTHPQIVPFEGKGVHAILRRAGLAYHNPLFEQAAGRVASADPLSLLW